MTDVDGRIDCRVFAREAHMDIPDGLLLGLFALGMFTIYMLLRKK